MARKAGRNTALYLSLDGTAAASPVAFLTKFSLNKNVSFIEVTAFSDANKVYVAGLPDAKGSVAGFYDGGSGTGLSDALYNASGDGIARAFYAYLDTTLSPVNDYFYGSAFWDFQLDTSVDGAISLQANWQAAGPIYRKRT
jgi:hypothetical protein